MSNSKQVLPEPPVGPEPLISAIAAYHASRPGAAPLAITCRDRTDGAGAQALAVISAMLWAQATGCRYVHTPFATIDHASGDRREWAAKWEAFLNFGHGEAPVPSNARILSPEEFVQNPIGNGTPDTVLAATGFHCLEFQTAAALQNLRPLLRARYYAADKSHLSARPRSPTTLTVAVHVRRGDVTADHPQRRFLYTQDEAILRTIEGVRSVAEKLGRRPRIYLFSEGRREKFAAFAAVGCRLRLSKDTFKTFHRLVTADVLVQAKSSFSYVAGLLSTGAVLHERYLGMRGELFYRPAPDWILRDGSGALDAGELSRLLEQKARASPLVRLKRWLPRL